LLFFIRVHYLEPKIASKKYILLGPIFNLNDPLTYFPLTSFSQIKIEILGI